MTEPMPRRLPWFPFYPADWTGDAQLSMASVATKGVWINVLSIAFYAPEPGKLVGTIDQIARAAGVTRDECVTFIGEARDLGFATINDLDGGRVEIVSRRMQRDAIALQKKRDSDTARQSRHRHGDVTRDVTPAVTGESQGARSVDSESESDSKKEIPRTRGRKKSAETDWPFGDDSNVAPDWWIQRAKLLGLDGLKEWRAWHGDSIARGFAYVNWKQASLNRLDRRSDPARANGHRNGDGAIPDSREIIRAQRESLS